MPTRTIIIERLVEAGIRQAREIYPRLAEVCLVGTEVERCPYCLGTTIRREGKRQKKHETIQLWYCRTCNRVFTPQRAKGKTYPLKIILESIMLYCQGYTRGETSQRINERFGIVVPPRTLSNWIAEYRPLTTYARLREEGAKRFRPSRIIRATRLQHQQVYDSGSIRRNLRASWKRPSIGSSSRSIRTFTTS